MLSEALAPIQAGISRSAGRKLFKAAHRFIYGKNNNQYNPLTDSSVIQRNLGGFPKPPRFCYTPIPSYLELLGYPELLIKAAHRFIYGKNNNQYNPLTDSSVIQRNLVGFPKPPRFCYTPIPSYLELLYYPELLIKAAHRFIYGETNKNSNLPNRFIGFQFIIGK